VFDERGQIGGVIIINGGGGSRMESERLRITLDSADRVYFAGDIIRGEIWMNVNKRTKIRGKCQSGIPFHFLEAPSQSPACIICDSGHRTETQRENSLIKVLKLVDQRKRKSFLSKLM